MGNYISHKNNNIETDKIINDQKNIIEECHNKILEQTHLIQVLRNQQEGEFCVRNGIVQCVEGNCEKDINDTKEKKDYEYLVFSGGGIKGISYIGALTILDKLGILCKIKGYAGTSVGSIYAALLAVGYSIDEVNNLMKTTDFENFVDDKWGYVRDAINFIDDYGVCPGKYAYNLFGDLIKKKTGNADYTISQLYKDTGIELVIVGTDLNNLKSIYFCHNSSCKANRDIPIRKAIRISMSIPFLFEPITHNNNYCVDGGVLDDFPLHVFDGDFPGQAKARLNLCPPNPKVLGLNIMSSDEIENYNADKRQDIDSLIDYSMSFINMFLIENERRIMTPSYWMRTICIKTPDYSFRKFSLTSKQKEDLIQAGTKYTNKFFK